MARLTQLRARMAADGIPALLVSDSTSIGWLTGFSGTFGRVIVTPEAGLFITDSRYAIQAAEQVSDLPIAVFASPVNGDEFVAEKARELGISELGFEAANVSYQAFDDLRAKMTGIDLRPAKDYFGDLRMVKTPEEISLIREACAIADAAFSHIQRLVRVGITEYDLMLELEFYIRRQGADIAFPSIVVSGERSARPHGTPSDKALARGDFVTFDFGARVGGYNSDITRTVVVEEATEQHVEIYGQVLKAQLAALEAIRPGVAAREVDAISRRVLDEKGLARYFGHGLGHGLGRVVHDTGRMNTSSDHVFAPGQVWTVEPGVYIPGFGGVRIEDDVVVTDSGIDILTKSTKDLLVLPKA